VNSSTCLSARPWASADSRR